MGCDIHLMAEIKKEKTWFKKLFSSNKNEWINIDKWSENPDFGKYGNEPKIHIAFEDKFYTGGRNYNLFCALCGVRSRSFYDNPPNISKPKGIPNDASLEYKEMVKEWGTDGHSHSWNTLRELQEFDWSPYGETCDFFRDEVITKMSSASKNPDDIRIVYFFDN